VRLSLIAITAPFLPIGSLFACLDCAPTLFGRGRAGKKPRLSRVIACREIYDPWRGSGLEIFHNIFKVGVRFFLMRRLKINSKKRGQVWVETVIYTLIGLAIMGLILAVAKPKIDEKKDQILIEQAIESLGNINNKVYEVQRAAGNRRAIDLQVGKGRLVIDAKNDVISWVLESSYEYSEEGREVPLGIINVSTRRSTPWEVTLKSAYAVDLRYDNRSTGTKELGESATPYKLVIENTGTQDGNTVIEFRTA